MVLMIWVWPPPIELSQIERTPVEGDWRLRSGRTSSCSCAPSRHPTSGPSGEGAAGARPPCPPPGLSTPGEIPRRQKTLGFKSSYFLLPIVFPVSLESVLLCLHCLCVVGGGYQQAFSCSIIPEFYDPKKHCTQPTPTRFYTDADQLVASPPPTDVVMRKTCWRGSEFQDPQNSPHPFFYYGYGGVCLTAGSPPPPPPECGCSRDGSTMPSPPSASSATTLKTMPGRGGGGAHCPSDGSWSVFRVPPAEYEVEGPPVRLESRPMFLPHGSPGGILTPPLTR